MTSPSPPAPPCDHTRDERGVCTKCGDCEHDVILNGACVYCGATDIDPVKRSPRPELIPPDRLRRR
jgi:hypothetical protein